MTEDEMLDGITGSMDMGLGGLRELVRLGVLQSMESERVVHDRATEVTRTDSSAGKESTCNVGGSINELGRSPGEGIDYPLQYSGLENSMDCIVHGVAKSQTQLSDFHLLT